MAGYPIGMEDLFVAKLIEDTREMVTYDKPIELAKAISGQISPQTASATMYANDKAAAQVNETTGAEVTLGVDDLNAEALELILGIKRNQDGVLVYDDKAQSPYVSILFKSRLHNGGYRYVSLTKEMFQLNEDSFNTKGESVELSGKEITGTFVLREHDGAWRFQVDDNDEGVNQDVIDNWFEEVYNPNPITQEP